MIKETFDLKFIIENFPKILKALPVTLLISLISLFFGWLLGLAAAIGKVRGPKWLRKILIVFTDIIRGIPTVVMLYVVYFGMSIILKNQFGINAIGFIRYIFIVLALTIEIATTSSETFRSAYNSIAKGQLEAAHALGYTNFERFIHIIFPQGLYVILPNLGNAVLSMVQATSLVYTLGIYDILGRARQIDTNAIHMKTFELYVAVSVIYWIIAIIVGQIFKQIEKAMGKGNHSVTKTLEKKKKVVIDNVI